MKSYLDILRRLNGYQVEYLIVGGIAVNLHNAPRMTFDLDIVILMTHDNLMNALDALKSLGFIPRLPISFEDISDLKRLEEWLESRNLKALSFLSPSREHLPVDILLDSPIDFIGAYASRKILQIDDVVVNVVSVDYLIKMKQVAGRMQDKADVDLLERAREGENGEEAE